MVIARIKEALDYTDQEYKKSAQTRTIMAVTMVGCGVLWGALLCKICDLCDNNIISRSSWRIPFMFATVWSSIAIYGFSSLFLSEFILKSLKTKELQTIEMRPIADL